MRLESPRLPSINVLPSSICKILLITSDRTLEKFIDPRLSLLCQIGHLIICSAAEFAKHFPPCSTRICEPVTVLQLIICHRHLVLHQEHRHLALAVHSWFGGLGVVGAIFSLKGDLCVHTLHCLSVPLLCSASSSLPPAACLLTTAVNQNSWI